MLLAAAAGLLLLAGPAAAHAELAASTPADGTVLPAPPAELELRFTEPVRLVRDGMRLVDPGGGRSVVDAVPLDGDPATVVVTLPTDGGDGGYLLSWRVVSADAHPVRGTVAFTAGGDGRPVAPVPTSESADPAAGGSSAVSLAHGVARFAGFAGLALLLGGVGFLVLCWPAGRGDVVLGRLVWTGWGVLMGATLAGLLLQGPYTAGEGLGSVLDPLLLDATLESRFGSALAVRVVLLAAAAVGLVALLRGAATGPREPVTVASWVGLALALPATWAAADHASTGRQVWLAIPVDVVHLLAMSLWLGGLAVLGVALLRRPRSGTRPDPRSASLRFSALALGCVAVLVVTGTYQAWRSVGAVDDLVGTDYGRLLLVKVGGFLGVLAVAAAARVAVRRAARRTTSTRPAAGELGRLRRSVVAEAGMAAAVLGVTAALVATPPARDVAAAADAVTAARGVGQVPVSLAVSDPSIRDPHTGHGGGDRGQVRVEVDPPAPGTPRVTITVLGADAGPAEVEEVRASVAPAAGGVEPYPLRLSARGRGVYVAEAVPLPAATTWAFAVTVRSSPIDEATARVAVVLA